MVRTLLVLSTFLVFSSLAISQSRATYDLHVQKQGSSVSLEWRTMEDLTISFYEIYKLNEVNGWELMETKEHHPDVLTWQVVDTTPTAGTNSYLLRALEVTGNPHFSGIEEIHFEASAFEVLVYPNPASEWIVINSDRKSTEFKAELVNRYGTTVAKETSKNGAILIGTSSVIEGIYYIRIDNGTVNYNKPVVINHR